MGFTRKLFVLAVMVFATMAFGASSASAVEVSDASTGNHCTAATLTSDHVVEGGCRFEAVSERETVFQTFVSGVGFVTFMTCEDHFEAAIGEDGTGYLYNATISAHAGNPCTRTQCDEATGTKIPWPIALTSTTNMEIHVLLTGRVRRCRQCRYTMSYRHRRDPEQRDGRARTQY
jgi:hypothetical protein